MAEQHLLQDALAQPKSPQVINASSFMLFCPLAAFSRAGLVTVAHGTGVWWQL